ncbi:hypothetical protein EYF80_041678 [Liparis tanakae]|uniref:Uncharacterized protein n=1 Tax=Liparis tanakae TaxID=230148 RepID=A0A4Z2G3G5_9TELE|nr:hypothetical protein EYF80_041678 [Liparis tanakae]
MIKRYSLITESRSSLYFSLSFAALSCWVFCRVASACSRSISRCSSWFWAVALDRSCCVLRGVLLLIVDGGVSLLQQHIQLFLEPMVLLLGLVQTADVCVVAGRVLVPPQLLAGLLHVVVLPDQLEVVLSHRLQLLFERGLLARQTAVQRTEERPTAATVVLCWFCRDCRSAIAFMHCSFRRS